MKLPANPKLLDKRGMSSNEWVHSRNIGIGGTDSGLSLIHI